LPETSEIDVIAPNFKRRLSGVTSTIVQLVPRQVEAGVRIVTIGPGLPRSLPKMSTLQIFGLWRPPSGGHCRVWHARRNIEMIAGLLLRDVLRMPLRLLFTSAAQRHHTGFTKFLIGRMDHVVATSARSGSYLDVAHDVVMHGIDTERFHPPSGTKGEEATEPDLAGRLVVGCSGRIRHQKGTDLFVDAMIALLPLYPRWSAVVTVRVTADNRAFADDLVRRVAAAGLSDRILFLGEVDDVRPWYRRFSLYVAPSRNEGFGLTPLEAMASATPVVASDAGAYAEMILPGKTGAVVAAGDGRALTKAIEPYLADPARTEQAGLDAREHVSASFSIAREVEGLAAIYRAMARR
jgi:mannosyltransferase